MTDPAESVSGFVAVADPSLDFRRFDQHGAVAEDGLRRDVRVVVGVGDDVGVTRGLRGVRGALSNVATDAV